MSIAYDVGFTRKPKLEELDQFMINLGFRKIHSQGLVLEPAGDTKGNFTRIYVIDDDSVPREIEFFFEEEMRDHKDLFGERRKDVHAYGNLKTFSTEMTHPDLDGRLRIIKEKNVRTQYGYYKHLNPERLKFYETALALRNHYNAIVVSEQTCEEINPDKPFPDK